MVRIHGCSVACVRSRMRAERGHNRGIRRFVRSGNEQVSRCGHSARGESRTRTRLPSADFESAASAIPPLGPAGNIVGARRRRKATARNGLEVSMEKGEDYGHGSFASLRMTTYSAHLSPLTSYLLPLTSHLEAKPAAPGSLATPPHLGVAERCSRSWPFYRRAPGGSACRTQCDPTWRWPCPVPPPR